MAKIREAKHSFTEDKLLPPLVLEIKDIKINPDVFQIRIKMRKDVVKTYKTVYENRIKMPPVVVAELKGVYYLVDGFHRVKALLQLNKEYVSACVIPVKNVEQARWLAVKYNSTHGLQLTSEDKIEAFDAYIKAKQYLKNGRKGCYKSMREIAGELGFWTHVTVRNRLMRFYNPIYQKMNIKPSQDNPVPPDIFGKESNNLTLADIALINLKDIYEQLHVLGKVDRRKVKDTALEILKRIDEINSQGDKWVYPKPDEDKEEVDF